MNQNKIKPTKKQEEALKHIKRGMRLRDSMIAAGYTPKTATHPKQNLIDKRGFQVLIHQYREDLKKAGISSEVLAEVQAEGLFDQSASVRLDYLQETKKDFGILQDKAVQQTQQVNIFSRLAKNMKEFIEEDEA